VFANIGVHGHLPVGIQPAGGERVPSTKPIHKKVPLNSSCLVPGIHVFLDRRLASKTWMAGTSPAMTASGLSPAHILNTPNFVSGTGAFSAAEYASASTRRVSDGAMMPSSHSRAVAK
jgi:hypothetical protein